MTRAVLADTGPLYAAVDPDDQLHARALSELTELAADGRRAEVVVTTMMEAYTLVLFRLGIQVAYRWLDQMSNGAVLIIPTAADASAAFALVRRYPDQDVALFDCLLATLSERLRQPVWTYDAHYDVLRTER